MSKCLSLVFVTKAAGNSTRMLQALDHHDVHGHPVSSPDELQALIAGDTRINGAFVELAGFGREVWDLCETLRQNDIPFFLISGDVSNVENLGTRHGARGTLHKPLSMTLLSELIDDLKERMTADNPGDSRTED